MAVLRDDFVEGMDVERFFGADVDGADAALVRYVDEAGGGIDGAGGADDEEDGGAVELAVDGVHVERNFAEPDDVRADAGVAGFADGEVIGVFVEGVIGEVLVGTSAAGLEEAAVHVVDVAGARRARGGRRRFGCRGRSSCRDIVRFSASALCAALGWAANASRRRWE